MAAMPLGATVRTGAQLWETDNWDEEDQVDQQRQKQGKVKRSVTPQVMPQVALPSETLLDCWDDADEDALVDSLQLKQAPAPTPAPEKDLELADKLAETRTAPSLPAGEVVAPKVKPAKVERYWGRVRWFRGCFGWVTSDNVSTDRTVNLDVHSRSHDVWTLEIRNAIFLHKKDCKGFDACYGMAVNFRIEPDDMGKSKCVDVRQENPEEAEKITLDDYKKHRETKATSKSMRRTSDSKPRERASGHDTQDAFKPHKDSRAKLSSNAPNDDTQRWIEGRMSKPNSTLATGKSTQAKLNPRNLELHSCSSSTAPGSSCNTSVASELDVQSQASARAGRPKRTLEIARADRPRHVHSSIAASITRVSRYLEIEEHTEEVASDQPPVAESWEDEVSEEDLDGVDTKVTTGYTKRSEKTVDVEIEPTEEAAPDQPPVAESWDNPPVAAPVAESWKAGEVPKCWCPKRPREKLANKKLAKPNTAPQEGQLAQFCEAMGPEFPFEFVARHLGADFDAIVQNASDVHSLDSLVRAGMKPLHRNKFCKALRQEMEQRVTRRESPKQGLADFLAKIGPEFDSAFLARNLGTDDLDEIVMRFTDLNDLDVLVVAGMKPLFRNKLYRQLTLERKRRAAEC